jgi:hypothetical protein
VLDSGTLVPIAFFVAVVAVVLGLARIISDGRTRRRLIEHGGSSDVARVLAELAAHERARPAALMWGIVAITAGAAFVVLQFLPFDEDDPIMAGVVLLFVGAGLLVYHRLTAGASGSRQG